MKKGLLIVVAIIVTILLGVCIFYNIALSPLEKSIEGADKKIVRVNIKEGMGISQIASLLEKEGVIKSADAMKIYSKLNRIKGHHLIIVFLLKTKLFHI